MTRACRNHQGASISSHVPQLFLPRLQFFPDLPLMRALQYFRLLSRQRAGRVVEDNRCVVPKYRVHNFQVMPHQV